MSSLLGLVTSFSTTLFSFTSNYPSKSSEIPTISYCPALKSRHFKRQTTSTRILVNSSPSAVEVEVLEEEVANGLTMTQFCDKIIDLFLNEKPKSKDWKRYLVFREEWKKYRDKFYSRCLTRAADSENDSQMKQKLTSLARKVKKIDEEMEMHNQLLKEIQDSPTDLNAIVSKRRKEFTGEFFRHLTLLSETYDGLEDRDGFNYREIAEKDLTHFMCIHRSERNESDVALLILTAVARLGARCLSAVSAFDNTLEIVETLDSAQAKFDDILNSPSIDAACEKIKNLAKSKQLDSSLILLINSAWASAKESTTMKEEVKDIMYRLYKATQSSLKSIIPKEIKLLKHLLNIIDPEDRFSALATCFSPGGEHDAKDPKAIHTTPNELHKWIKIMLDAYHLSKEETDIREANQMSAPVVIQRLQILKETIENEYMEKDAKNETDTKSDDE